MRRLRLRKGDRAFTAAALVTVGVLGGLLAYGTTTANPAPVVCSANPCSSTVNGPDPTVAHPVTTSPVTATTTVSAPPQTVTTTVTASPTSSTTATPTTTTPTTTAADATAPLGASGSWRLAFADEFNGTALDTKKWSDCSWAEPDGCHGNLGNTQLEWNQADNCTVADGVLTMTARRESHTSASGQTYDWTSCLLTTARSYAFQFGYLEERAMFPAPRGFWPSLWTWQAPGVNAWVETNAYEYYSDNHTALYMTHHSGSGGSCKWTPPFDPSAGFHTYGVDIEPGGTTWFVDGTQVCNVPGTSTGRTNVVDNLAVYSGVPPDAATTSATKTVDYVRVWRH
jgi:beta-glucanase (GH16 family)